MASHDNARKKRKMSHMDPRASHSHNPPLIASSSALPTPPSAAGMDNITPKPAAPCQHEQALHALNTDLDAMRQLVTCKICDRLLYEPYALSCGHTYCYSCLAQWLTTNAKMTCPDCRIVVRQQPTPSYLIRELVLIFVSRNELLPDGETTEEHDKQVREEGAIVAKDKANADPRTGGLFRGRFNRGRLNILGPLHDAGDNVHRCPECLWELEDGHCNSCGFEADSMDDDFSDHGSDSIISDEDVDVDLRDMDGEDGFLGPDGADEWGLHEAYRQARRGIDVTAMAPAPNRWNQWRRHAHPDNPDAPIDLGSTDDESEENEYDQNDTFIDDEAIEENSDDASSDVTAGRDAAPPERARHIRFRGAPVVLSEDENEDDDDDDDDDVRVVGSLGPAPRGRLARRRPTPVIRSEDEDDEGDETAPSTAQGADESASDSEDEGPVARGSQRNKRPNVAVRSRRAVTVSSSEDESDSPDPEGFDGASEGGAPGGFSPLNDGYGDEVGLQTDYDEDDYGDLANTGFVGDSFDPEEASVGGYDEESDDRCGPATTRHFRPTPPRLAPSSRLETLQQRRARHHNAEQRPGSLPSPTAERTRPFGHRGVEALNQRQSLLERSLRQPDTHNQLTNAARPYGYGAPAQAQTQQPIPHHPFQLDNLLTRLNSDAVHPSNNYNPQLNRVFANNYYDPEARASHAPTINNYNQRAQQTRASAAQLANQNARVTMARGLGHNRHREADHGSVTAAPAAREMAGAHRKRALSIESDDSGHHPV